MEAFLQKHADAVTGTLTGFDRLVFRGTLRNIAYVAGLDKYLGVTGVLLKDFGKHAESVSNALKAAGRRVAEAAGRPVQFLRSSKVSKEIVALDIAKRDRITRGLLCILTSVEPCQSFEIRKDRETKRICLQASLRKCLFMYHYAIHPVFGFMNARIQTWFPFSIQICLNGREWLARDMDREGLSYLRHDNCFPWIEDTERAQELMDQQLSAEWPGLLGRISRRLNPAHEQIFDRFESDYYWSTYQSEVATDVMFRDAKTLAALYPSFVQHGITSFQSPDVLRFLGKRLNQDGRIHGSFAGEVTGSLKRRQEGVRVKHAVNGNSVKIYDKAGSVLRVETTINNPRDLKVFRPKEGGPDGEKDWRKLRKGIADLHRLADLSRASNARYLEALSRVSGKEPLGALVEGITKRRIWKGKRFRGMRPYSKEDAHLLEAVARGEFAITGFRNRDLRVLLFRAKPGNKKEERRRAGKVTRKLGLLRAHGLIKKVPRSHRYQLTADGRKIVVALLAARAADVTKLTRAA